MLFPIKRTCMINWFSVRITKYLIAFALICNMLYCTNSALTVFHCTMFLYDCCYFFDLSLLNVVEKDTKFDMNSQSTLKPMAEAVILPKDVVFRIISFMDIDTRRSLGIYTKLKIPQALNDKISATFREVDVIDNYSEFSCDGSDGDRYSVYIPYKGYCEELDMPMDCSYEICHEIFSERVFYHIIHHKYVFVGKTRADYARELADYLDGTGPEPEHNPEHEKYIVQWDYAYGYENGDLKDVLHDLDYDVLGYREFTRQFALHLDYLFAD